MYGLILIFCFRLSVWCLCPLDRPVWKRLVNFFFPYFKLFKICPYSTWKYSDRSRNFEAYNGRPLSFFYYFIFKTDQVALNENVQNQTGYSQSVKSPHSPLVKIGEPTKSRLNFGSVTFSFITSNTDLQKQPWQTLRQTTETDLHLKMSFQKLGPQVKIKQQIFRVAKEIVGIQCH